MTTLLAAKALAAICGALLTLAAVYRKLLRKPLHRAVAILRGLALVPEIAAELQPNGGASLRDVFDKLVRGQNYLVEVTDHQTRLIADQGRRLHEWTETYWSLNQQARCGIFKTDAAGDCIKVNQTYCRLTGRTEAECFGGNWIYCIAPENRDEVMREWNAAVEHQRNFELNYIMMHSDGHLFPVLGKASVIRDPVGEVIGWIGTIAKIPEKPKELHL